MDWTLEEVCQWLELVGLGMYRQTFRGIVFIVYVCIWSSSLHSTF